MTPTPAASEIEDTFRRIIRERYRDQDYDNLTVKRVRAAAEERLGLKAGFFLDESTSWKERSKKFVEAEAVGFTSGTISLDLIGVDSAHKNARAEDLYLLG
jgi:hypothetical protein